MKRAIEEFFDPAPGGSAGALNFQAPLGTHSSPANYTQDPPNRNNFFNSDTTGQPDTKITAYGDGSFDDEIDKLFAGKEKPTLDDLTCGIQYELSKMLHKDKQYAKEVVIDNMLKYGPKYYSRLSMLNIDEPTNTNLTENMNANPQMKERVNVLNQMVAEKQAKRVGLELNDEIKNILNQKREEKFAKADSLIKLSNT